jgi:hypothetical protein
MKILKLIFFVLIWYNFSCNIKKNENSIKKDVKEQKYIQLTDSKLKSEGTYFFNTDGGVLINWTETHKEPNSNRLKFAFFDKKSNKFKSEIDVPQAKGLQLHAESMAKIGKTKKGILYAFYRRRAKNRNSRFGGSMYYVTSSDNGKTWTDEKKLVLDKKSTSQSFFDIALLKNGEIGVIWLDSRKPVDKNHKGKTLYFASTNSTTKKVENEKPIAGSTCECCRTDIFTDKQGKIHIAYRNIIDKNEPDFSGDDPTEIRDMYYLFSDNNGRSFSKPLPLSKDNWHFYGCPHTGPSLAESNGVLAATWYTGAPHNNGIFFIHQKKNKFIGKTLLSKTGYHPQMTANKNAFFIVYEEYYENNGKGYNLIELETIEANKKSKIEISQKLTENDHPVITKIDSDLLLIAWVNKNTRNPKIIYTIYNVK